MITSTFVVSTLLSSVFAAKLELSVVKDQILLEIKAHHDVIQHLQTINEAWQSDDQLNKEGQKALDLAANWTNAEMMLDDERSATFHLMKSLLADIGESVKKLAAENKPPEQKFYDEALVRQSESNWQEAFDLLKKSWAAYNETEKAGQKHTVDLIYIYEWMEYVAFKLDNIEEALQICKRALSTIETMDQFHKDRFQVSVDFYEKLLTDKTIESPAALAKKLADSAKYDLCQPEKAEEMKRNLSTKPYAVCRLTNRNWNPLLILSPLKEEILSLSPPVVFFHDIVTNAENAKLKDLALKKFSSAQILSHQTKNTKVEEETRKAKVAWLEKENFPNLTKRLEAVTQLNPYGDGAETYQVSKYETSGHYIAHFDMLFDVANGTGLGDRIATLLIYLNDVEEGGATVFTQLNVHQLPQKNGALFWYNLYQDESYNLQTLHAACPVLKGQKFVTNMWFRFRGQFSHKPCPLNLNSSKEFTIEKY